MLEEIQSELLLQKKKTGLRESQKRVKVLPNTTERVGSTVGFETQVS